MHRHKKAFTKRLMNWHEAENTRSMPWKGEKDPYKIWLSEIILQQTRVEQGWAYYERIIAAFPTVQDLARAKPDKVFKLWEGLGYYSRCKNLMETAKRIAGEFDGRFPDNYQQIRSLKGIGPYTAAAIASFAYGLPHAVVDGNVERVLARYFASDLPVDTAAGKAFYTKLAGSLLDETHAGEYNQAIMDFGALICKPKNPLCTACMQQPDCQAFRQHKVQQLPVKKKKAEKKIRCFFYLVLETNGQFYIRRRTEKDIWQNLFEFILVESSVDMDVDALMQTALVKDITGKKSPAILSVSPVLRQQLTHQTVVGRFIRLSLLDAGRQLKDYQLVSPARFSRYPFPRLITNYLEKFPLLP